MCKEKTERLLCLIGGIALALLALIFIPRFIRMTSARLYKRKNGRIPASFVDRDPVIVRRSDEKPLAGKEKRRVEQKLEQERDALKAGGEATL